MDEFQACVNSYRVLINNEDPWDLMINENIVDYVIDPFEDNKETLLVGLNLMIKNFEEYEHYEMCNNILKHINIIENGI